MQLPEPGEKAGFRELFIITAEICSTPWQAGTRMQFFRSYFFLAAFRTFFTTTFFTTL